MNLYTDQTDWQITLNQAPQRIVSLVPSQTELLFELGLGERIVGLTRFCTHPKKQVQSKTKVGGTKNFSIETIRQIKPDLILANKEENTKELIEKLRVEFPVWTSDISNYKDALQMIRAVAEICHTHCKQLVEDIENGFRAIEVKTELKGLYLIWRKPFMAAGKQTFISDMMKKIGIINICPLDRYPELSTEQIAELCPEMILLSSEPYPFKEKHIAEIKAISPLSEVRLVDGEMFSWYGSRMSKAAHYFLDFWK
jgi:ABC-type Fe3+-hydroxamate transport system substrate-binding protein